ncbi:fructosidase [Leuconostoc litchii]|uniref:Glycoside hydrolase family 32 protein n=1 Tax=Leuconostoc litchii TaxID=1981069 RepID=A0A6P2CMH2_9LACO|nr:glycoside hydrolase family 32 protein [Leuconostoc litchii]TYC47225.1 glycoside hydrolase family 32 protein [Leuconostoc litchii]GMA69206.1 fructosidase [Leuconostoc litchii]
MKIMKILGILGVCLLLPFIETLSVEAGTLTSNECQQYYHHNIEQGFMNDVQSVWQDEEGYYHIYYLADLNYKHDNDGTEWYHVKTKDFIHYENLGIAIPKFQNKWEAVATGSVIKNTSGFFSDLPKQAIVSYFTSYTPNGQKQFAAYSTDNGLTYKPYSDDAVMTSPSTTAHFRDPYVFINKKTNKLTMYLAEGDKIGVYSSENGKKFDYVGAISLNKYALNGKDLGLIECPNLKTMYDVSTGATKEVLFFGGNGYNYGQTSGSYYMVGHLSDEGVFIVEQQPKRVDDGSDFYASNYFQTANNTNIISIAWLGNWSYSAKKIIDANYEQSYKLGSLSLAHKLNLTQKDGQYILKSSLIKPYSCLTNKTSQYVEASKQTRKTDGYYQLLNTRRWTSQNFYLQMTNQNQGKVNGHIKLSFKQKDSTVLFDYNADTGYYNVQRQTTNIADEEGNSEYSRIFTENSGVINPETFKLHVYVDKASIELEFENSERTYSLLKYTTDDDLSFKVETNSENNLFYTMSNIENSH